MMLGIGFLCIIIVGYLVLDLFASGLHLEEKLSLSYGVGIGFVSLLMFLLLYFRFLNSEAQLVILMVLISIVLFIINLAIKRMGNLNLSNYFGRWDYKLLLWISPLFIFSLVFAYYYPIMITDGNDYEITGRLMALNKSIEAENFFRPYPPLIPVIYSFIYFLGGVHPKIIFSFFYLSLVLCFYFRLNALEINRRSSIIFTLILATTPFMWWHSFLGILNLTAAYYFSIATLFWFSHLKNVSESGNGSEINYSHPLLAGVFYGLSIFARFEMLAYFLIPLILTAFYSLKYHLTRNLVYLALPSLGISTCWSFFSGYMTFSGENFRIFSVAIIIFMVALVLSYFILIREGHRNLIGFIDKCERRIFSLTKALGLGFAIFFIVYVLIPQNMQNNLDFITQLAFFIKTLVTKSITCIAGNVFFLSTSVLILLLLLSGRFIKYEDSRREHIYLFVLIISFFMLNIIIFTCLFFSGYPEGYSVADWNYELGKLLKTVVYHPGQVVNNTQIRGLLPLYPIIIFFFAISRKVQDAFEV